MPFHVGRAAAAAAAHQEDSVLGLGFCGLGLGSVFIGLVELSVPGVLEKLD